MRKLAMMMAAGLALAAPIAHADETYDRECTGPTIRPGFVGYCNWAKDARDKARDRQERTGLIEGQWYLVAKDSVICEVPDSLHIGQTYCVNIPAGEPVRMLYSDGDGHNPVVWFKMFPGGGSIPRDAIGPAANCTVTETADNRPYSSTTPIRHLTCLPLSRG